MFKIFVSTDQIKCFLCKTIGHTASKCPDNISSNATTTTTVNEIYRNNSRSTSKITVPVEIHMEETGRDKSHVAVEERVRVGSETAVSES